MTFRRASVPAEFTDLLNVGSETNCRYLWSKQIKKSSWQAIGNRQSGKSVTTLTQFKLMSEAYIEPLGKTYCSVDVFMSPNQFWDWRNTKQLAKLHANWLEIDTAGHSILSLEEQESVVESVLNAVSNLGIPTPTGYVTSGSGGLHLYWIYPCVDAFKWRTRVWREITYVMAKKLKTQKDTRWKVDFSASRDPARVLRVPGTFHGRSGRIATAYIGGPSYTFDSLARLVVTSKQNLNALDTFESGKLIDFKSSNVSTKPQEFKPSKGTKHNIKGWWFRIYSQIVSHARKHGIKEGQRDLFAFITFVALQHIKESNSEALTSIKQINRELIKLDDDDLDSYLKTALTTRYKYKKDTVAEYLENNLGIPSDFLYQENRKLSKDEVKAAQSLAAKRTADRKRSKTMDCMIDAYRQLSQRGELSKQALAKVSGYSIKTVTRYWALLADCGTLAGPVYIPPKEIVKKANMDLSNTASNANSPCGAVSAKCTFTSLCKLISDMQRLCESETGIIPILDFAARGRLTKVILSLRMDADYSELLAVTMVSLMTNSRYSNWTLDDWVGYLIVAGRNYQDSYSKNTERLLTEFEKFLRGESFFLTDSDLKVVASQSVLR